MSISLQERAGLSGSVDRISGSVTGPLDRVKTTISELGYEAIIEALMSPELIGRAQSLLASDEVMVVSRRPANEARPILLAVTEDRRQPRPALAECAGSAQPTDSSDHGL